MAAIEEQVLVAMKDLFTTALTGIATVYRNREIPLDRNETPAVVINMADGNAQAVSQMDQRLDFEVEVEMHVRGEPWETAVDPIRVAGHAALLLDETLGGLVARTQLTRTQWAAANADRTAGCCTHTYRFTTLTPRRDLTRLAGY